MGCMMSATRNRSSTDSRVNPVHGQQLMLAFHGDAVAQGPSCTLCVYFSSKTPFSTISVTKRCTTSGMARNSCDPRGSARYQGPPLDPDAGGKTSRVRFRRRMASRRKACWEMVMTGPKEEDLYTQCAYYSQHKRKSNTFAHMGLPGINGLHRPSSEEGPSPPARPPASRPRRRPARPGDSRTRPAVARANGRASDARCSLGATG